MKIIILLISLSTLFISSLQAQAAALYNATVSQECKIYKGREKMSNAVPLYTIERNRILQSDNTVAFTINTGENGILIVNHLATNHKYKIDKNQIKDEKDSPILNIKNGEVYHKDSSSRLQILYTLKDGKIYKGRSTSSLDIIYSYQENAYTNKVLIALLTHIDNII